MAAHFFKRRLPDLEVTDETLETLVKTIEPIVYVP